jgi:small multidrug resistance pump
MAWLYLVAAIVTEVIGTTSMKFAEGFTRLIPSILVFVFYGLSLVALTLALKRIDVSVAYAVWSGLGTAMIAAIGLLIFKEPLSLVKMLSLLCIIAGVIGLNAVGGVH